MSTEGGATGVGGSWAAATVVWRGGGQQWGREATVRGFWLYGALTAWMMCTGGDWGGGDKVRGGWCWGVQPPWTALHAISIRLQNSFCESHTWRLVSWKALRALNARWAQPVYPIFEDEKSNGSDEKSVKQKIAFKKTDRTNIIATNFVGYFVIFRGHVALSL